MGRTNRDRIHKNQYVDEEEDDSSFRKESKKKRKRDRRTVEQNLKDIVLSGEFDEYDFDEEFYSDE